MYKRQVIALPASDEDNARLIEWPLLSSGQTTEAGRDPVENLQEARTGRIQREPKQTESPPLDYDESDDWWPASGWRWNRAAIFPNEKRTPSGKAVWKAPWTVQ